MTKGIYAGAIPGAPGPGNVEAKLRELVAACDIPPGEPLNWPSWLEKPVYGKTLAAIFQEAADELEQRSRYAGNLLRRLAGD